MRVDIRNVAKRDCVREVDLLSRALASGGPIRNYRSDRWLGLIASVGQINMARIAFGVREVRRRPAPPLEGSKSDEVPSCRTQQTGPTHLGSNGKVLASTPPAATFPPVPYLARKTERDDTRRSLRMVPLGFVCGILRRPMARSPVCACPAACLLHVCSRQWLGHPPLIV
jgi:hypothetical protein